jgi:hypothetical protein
MSQEDIEKNTPRAPHKIESLKSMIYFKKSLPRKTEQELLSPREVVQVPKEWPKEHKMYLEKNPPVKVSSPFVRFFFISLVFFIGTLIFVGYNQFRLEKKGDPSRISLSIEGPSQVAGGDTYPFTVRIENTGDGAIDSARLFVEYQADTQSENKRIETIYKEIGSLDQNSIKNIPISFALFGEQGSTQAIVATVEYTMRGSSDGILLVKKSSLPILISSTPLGFRVSLPDAIISGQEIQIEMVVLNQSKNILKNILTKIETPPGFILKKTIPESVGPALWDTGDINPGEEKTYSLVGILQGDDLSEKAFRFTAGKSKEGEGVEKGLSTLQMYPVYNSMVRTVRITPSPLKVSLLLNQKKSSMFTFETQKKIGGEIYFENNTTRTFSNIVFKLNLNTDQFSFDIDSDKGIFSKEENTITWNTKDESPYGISPGTKGSFPFSFIIKNKNAFSVPNSDIDMSVGVFVETPEGIQNIGSLARSVARVVSDVQLIVDKKTLTTKTTTTIPRVGKKILYNITFSLVNSHGQVSGMKLQTFLPPGIEIEGGIKDADLVYTPSTRSLVWNLGVLEPFVGQKTAPKKISFTLSLTPNKSQIDTTPALLNDITISGFDVFAGKEINIKRQGLTTRSGMDPGSELQAVVQE